MGFYTDPSRLGQANLAGDTDALFLKVFSGEIVTTFEKANVMMPLHRVRTIQSGKSASFPVTGVASATYHTPGESVLSQGAAVTGGFANTISSITPVNNTIAVEGTVTASKYLSRFAHNERVVFIDDILVSTAFIADIDEMKNHYDVRSVYSTEIGRQLAYTADKNLMRTVVAGARRQTTDRFGTAVGTDTTYFGAVVPTGALLTSVPTTSSLLAGFAAVAQKMDQKNVPNDDRFCVLTPAMYYLLLGGNHDAINRDWAPDNGSLATGQIASAYGIKILKSNNLPSAVETSTSESALHGNAGVKNNVATGANTGTLGYSGLDYSTTVGICFQREAVATVKLLDLSLETDYITERMGTLMLAKYAMGHNVLREECCYELTNTTSGIA